MATKPVHEFTRAKIPNINNYCGVNVLTETSPEPLDQTSPWTSKSTWTPLSTTEHPTTLTLFNRRSRPKPISEIATDDLIGNTTKIVLHVTTAKVVSSPDEAPEINEEEHLLEEPVEEPLPEQCCGATEEEQLNQSSSLFKIMHDLRTFVMHLILIIVCFI